MERYKSITYFRSQWKNAWSSRSFRTQFLVSVATLLIISIFISHFFNFIQQRPGAVVNDWLLSCFAPKDFSILIFLLIYSVIVISLVQFSFKPELLLKVLQAYALLLVLRICSLYFVPLEPSPIIIPLEDPIINRFFYANAIITKDLFFSGHVSTVFLLFLANPVKRMKYFMAVLSFFTASFILVQHVHYTIDILAAPLFAWMSFKLVNLIPTSSL